MRLTRLETVFKRGQKSARTFQLESHLGNEAEVHYGIGDRRVRRDKAGVATHQFDKSDAARGALSLDMRVSDYVRGLRDGGFKAERTADELKIVVDRLRNSDNRNLEIALHTLLRDFAGAPQRAVAADAEENIYIHSHQRIDDDIGRLLTAAGAENRSAELVNRIDCVGVEHYGLISEIGIKPGITETDAENVLDAVIEGENLDEALDHVVKSGAETAGRNYADTRPVRIVKNFRQRSSAFESRKMAELLLHLLHIRLFFRNENTLAFTDKLVMVDR